MRASDRGPIETPIVPAFDCSDSFIISDVSDKALAGIATLGAASLFGFAKERKMAFDLMGLPSLPLSALFDDSSSPASTLWSSDAAPSLLAGVASWLSLREGFLRRTGGVLRSSFVGSSYSLKRSRRRAGDRSSTRNRHSLLLCAQFSQTGRFGRRLHLTFLVRQLSHADTGRVRFLGSGLLLCSILLIMSDDFSRGELVVMANFSALEEGNLLSRA